MDPLPCPLCGEHLEPTKRRHGLVWVCHTCRAGAVTLPILRQAAPQTFINQLWQTALHHGRPSRVRCPACRLPFTEFRGATATVNSQLKVCVRCFWVWLRPGALSSSATADSLPPTFAQAPALISEATREEDISASEACQTLSTLAAGVLRRLL